MCHVAANHILNVDLRSFFASVHAQMLACLFERNHLAPVSNDLVTLVTYGGHLPTGAPTSPALANAVCYDFDRELYRYALTRDLRYTRYVDDLTFSSKEFIPPEVLKEIEDIVIKHGFQLNEGKTRFAGLRQRQEVTGLVLNPDPSRYHYAPRIRRTIMRNVRALIHANPLPYDVFDAASGRVLKTDGPCLESRRILGYRGWAASINPLQGKKIDRWIREAQTRGPHV
jgi:hypothetical protein